MRLVYNGIVNQTQPAVPVKARPQNMNTTEKAQHTPGPWTIHPKSASKVADSNGETVAACGRIGVTNAEVYSRVLADARLIAAAPDLLAACIALKEDLGHISLNAFNEIDEKAKDMLLAAIAKACGE